MCYNGVVWLSKVCYNVSIADSVYYNKFCIADMLQEEQKCSGNEGTVENDRNREVFQIREVSNKRGVTVFTKSYTFEIIVCLYHTMSLLLLWHNNRCLSRSAFVPTSEVSLAFFDLLLP